LQNVIANDLLSPIRDLRRKAINSKVLAKAYTKPIRTLRPLDKKKSGPIVIGRKKSPDISPLSAKNKKKDGVMGGIKIASEISKKGAKGLKK